MNCRQATRFISDAMESPLNDATRLRLRLHILICPACRHFARQVDDLRQITAAYPGPEQSLTQAETPAAHASPDLDQGKKK